MSRPPVCRRAHCPNPARCGPLGLNQRVAPDDEYCDSCLAEVKVARARAQEAGGPKRHVGYLR